jgi:hypothetical protein
MLHRNLRQNGCSLRTHLRLRSESHAGAATKLRMLRPGSATELGRRAHLLLRMHILCTVCRDRARRAMSELRRRVSQPSTSTRFQARSTSGFHSPHSQAVGLLRQGDGVTGDEVTGSEATRGVKGAGPLSRFHALRVIRTSLCIRPPRARGAPLHALTIRYPPSAIRFVPSSCFPVTRRCIGW